MRIDAHQHFWQYSPEEYAWISDEMRILQRDYLPLDLEPLLAQANLNGCVAVQARQSLDETRWLLELAGRHAFIKGVVGWVDLCSKAADEQLSEFGAYPKLAGTRHVLHDEPDDAFMLRNDFQAGLRKLRAFDLVYDLLLFPRHLTLACELVRAFPDQPFVLDHIAKPPISAGEMEPWRTDIRALAAFPNVACKLSGMVTEARWHAWRAEDFRPYLEVVLEAFGADRLMIGSDWPVCLVAGTYAETMKIVTDFVGQLSADEREQVLGGNCARIYGLKE